jgi:hypothetical protein
VTACSPAGCRIPRPPGELDGTESAAGAGAPTGDVGVFRDDDGDESNRRGAAEDCVWGEGVVPTTVLLVVSMGCGRLRVAELVSDGFGDVSVGRTNFSIQSIALESMSESVASGASAFSVVSRPDFGSHASREKARHIMVRMVAAISQVPKAAAEKLNVGCEVEGLGVGTSES